MTKAFRTGIPLKGVAGCFCFCDFYFTDLRRVLKTTGLPISLVFKFIYLLRFMSNL